MWWENEISNKLSGAATATVHESWRHTCISCHWRTIQYADNVVSSADCTMHVRGKSVDRLSAEHRQEIKQFACKGTLDVSGFAACSTCFNSLWESNRPNCKQLRKVWYVRGGWYTCRPIHWPLIAGLCGGYMLPHVNTPYRIVSHGLS